MAVGPGPAGLTTDQGRRDLRPAGPYLCVLVHPRLTVPAGLVLATASGAASRHSVSGPIAASSASRVSRQADHAVGTHDRRLAGRHCPVGHQPVGNTVAEARVAEPAALGEAAACLATAARHEAAAAAEAATTEAAAGHVPETAAGSITKGSAGTVTGHARAKVAVRAG